MMKMDPLFRSLISTFLCVGGPLILWVAYQVRPDLFVGKLKQVKWVTGFFMVLMIFTLFSTLNLRATNEKRLRVRIYQSLRRMRHFTHWVNAKFCRLPHRGSGKW